MIKQRETNSWKSVSYAKSITGAQTYTKFPIVLRTTEQSIPTWSVKGNTTTSGTPTPSNPMSVNGVGDKTANLFNVNAIGNIYPNPPTTTQRVGLVVNNLDTNNDYYLSINNPSQIQIFYARFDGETRLDTSALSTTANVLIPMTGANAIRFWVSEGDSWSNITNIMLSKGSTALPYEPFGYKIPISSGGVTTPIYLSQQLMAVESADTLSSSGTVTYQYNRYEITGAEVNISFFTNSGGKIGFQYEKFDMLSNSRTNGVCSHFTPIQSISWASTNTLCFGANNKTIYFIFSNDTATQYNLTDLASMRQWLADQYAAGTPVTIVYPLETPTTETVTVPTIPTTSSPTTIDVNTSVKPSEMSLTYDGYKICKPTKIVIPEPSEWIAKSWNGYNGMVGSSIWSDGDNIYYSMAMYQYVLNKSTSTWSAKTWNGLTSFNGAHIWTDGDNVYYSFGDDQYVLNRQTSTWSAKTWNGLASFDGGYVWTDGNNVYYSRSSNQYILDKATSTWVEKEWNGLTSFDGSSVWFEGNNIYYSYGLTRYVLNKSTSTWSEKVWTNAPYNMDGGKIWSVNGYNFYSNGTYEQYVLDKSTSTWSTKTWTGFTSFSGRNIWTDGTNIYVSDGIGKQYVLVR